MNIINIKYFYERNDINNGYNNIWEKNKEKIILLQKELSLSEQKKYIIDNLNDNKKIFAIKNPTDKIIKNNPIFNSIILGNGFIFNNKVWYPTEIWIWKSLN